jgi:hypothetical protein
MMFTKNSNILEDKMKKILISALLIVASATYSFAAPLTPGTVTVAAAQVFGGVDAPAALAAPTPLIRYSTGVSGVVLVTGTTDYIIATKHVTGSKIFATGNTATNIYWKQAGTGILGSTGNTLGFTTSASSNLVGSGWTSY